MAKQKKEIIDPLSKYPISVETFRPIADGYWLNDIGQVQPSCFNGEVRFRKFKLTIELVDEPISVLEQRLEDLWINSKNHNDYQPLMSAAKQIGYTFKGKWGEKINI